MMKKISCLILFCTAVALVSIQAQSDNSEIAQPITSIEFEENTFQWGELIEGEKIQNVFTFTNTGTEPLIISNAKGSCGCTVPRWPKEPIMPGETADLLVQFDSTNKGKKGGSLQVKRVTITANTDPAHTFLTIKGTVLKPETPVETELSKERYSNFDIRSDQLSVYPNPANDFIHLRFSDFKSIGGIVEIYNGQGIKVANKIVDDLEQELSLDIRNYVAGTYTVSLKVEGKNRIAKRFVVLGS